MAKKPKKGEKTPAEDTLSIEGEAAVTSEASGQQGPMLSVLAQYTKDQSFENPGAPNSLRSGLPAPQISVNIEIGRQMLDDDSVEVTLILKAEARRENDVAFIAELEYAGLFAFQGVGMEEIQPLIMIECPRLLFPFARRVIADATRDGGFSPLMLDPIDFAGLYSQNMKKQQDV